MKMVKILDECIAFHYFYLYVTTAVDCGSLPAPDNGVITINTSIFRSTATYSCDVGYQLNENASRICLASGNWSGSQPSCNSK